MDTNRANRVETLAQRIRERLDTLLQTEPRPKSRGDIDPYFGFTVFDFSEIERRVREDHARKGISVAVFPLTKYRLLRYGQDYENVRNMPPSRIVSSRFGAFKRSFEEYFAPHHGRAMGKLWRYMNTDPDLLLYKTVNTVTLDECSPPTEEIDPEGVRVVLPRSDAAIFAGLTQSVHPRKLSLSAPRHAVGFDLDFSERLFNRRSGNIPFPCPEPEAMTRPSMFSIEDEKLDISVIFGYIGSDAAIDADLENILPFDWRVGDWWPRIRYHELFPTD